MAERSRPPNGSSKLCGDHPAKLGTEEAEMQIIGVDLHTRQQTVAMLNVETGEIVEKTLQHEGDSVREFYSTLPRPTGVGREATGSMQWFLELMEELGIDCEVGHPAKIRAAEPRKQKHDRRDAALVLQLLVENRFTSIWMPSREQRDVRSLILYRHQWVRIRTRVQNALQAIALRDCGEALRCGARWASTRSPHCHSLAIQPNGGPHCNRCISNSSNRSPT